MSREHEMRVTLISEVLLEFLRNSLKCLLFTRKQGCFRTSSSWPIGRKEYAPQRKSARLNRSHNAKSNGLRLDSAAVVGCLQRVGDCLVHWAWIGLLRSKRQRAAARGLNPTQRVDRNCGGIRSLPTYGRTIVFDY